MQDPELKGGGGGGFWTDEEIGKNSRSWEEETGKDKSHRTYISQGFPQSVKWDLIKAQSVTFFICEFGANL